MSSNVHFQKYFTVDAINKISDDLHFANNVMIEKYIMNFEGFYHILKEIPDCIIKGGMAVPFHLEDITIRRLSTDIDIVTSLNRSKVESAMKKISRHTAGILEIPDPHTPKNPTLSLPLLTYYCNYNSLFSEDQEITIEIIHDHDNLISTKTISPIFNILGFELDFPITVYDQGSLIGDKLTTLAFNTIGLQDKRASNTPKQIYDISKLIKSLQKPLPINEICNSIEKTSSHQLSYIESPQFNFQDILDDLENFDKSLLIFKNGFMLNPTAAGRFEQFASQLLGNTSYLVQDHIADILLIKYMALLIKNRFNQSMNDENISSSSSSSLVELISIASMNANQEKELIKTLVTKHGGKKSKQGSIIKTLIADQAFLYDKILELS